MTSLNFLLLIGRIKQAEMELWEAAYKAGDDEDATAVACLCKASEAIGEAMALMKK